MNSLAKLLNQFFDNKMEDFETAFPAVVDSLNDDGTLNIRPSVRNCLRNMQMEPNDENGKIHLIRNVPILWSGTQSVFIDFELSAGDTILCVCSSRDIRNWKEGEWDETTYNPLSFSGNDLLNALAIPYRRKVGDAKTKIHIDTDGNVTIETSKVEIDGDLSVTGNINVDGSVEAKGDVSTTMNPVGKISLMSHLHKCTTPGNPTSPPDPTLSV